LAFNKASLGDAPSATEQRTEDQMRNGRTGIFVIEPSGIIHAPII
jgi:hypothetical protein